jgi:hypothetical protein
MEREKTEGHRKRETKRWIGKEREREKYGKTDLVREGETQKG